MTLAAGDPLRSKHTRGRRGRTVPVNAVSLVLGGSFSCWLSQYEASAADRSLDQAFGFEPFVGGGDGSPVQSKLTSQFPSSACSFFTSIEVDRLSIKCCTYPPNWR